VAKNKVLDRARAAAQALRDRGFVASGTGIGNVIVSSEDAERIAQGLEDESRLTKLCDELGQEVDRLNDLVLDLETRLEGNDMAESLSSGTCVLCEEEDRPGLQLVEIRPGTSRAVCAGCREDADL